MKITLDVSGLLKRVDGLGRRAKDMRPAAQRIGEYWARAARRKAPRGEGARQASLQSSINHAEPAHNEVTLRSDKPYARIQALGGTVRAGTGRLATKALPIPLTDRARAIVRNLGAGTSLRQAPVKMFVVQIGANAFLATKASGKGQTSTRRDRRGRERSRRQFATAATGQQIEILFLLKRSVHLKPNPAPAGYVPTLENDAEFAAFVQRTVKRYLLAGQS